MNMDVIDRLAAQSVQVLVKEGASLGSAVSGLIRGAGKRPGLAAGALGAVGLGGAGLLGHAQNQSHFGAGADASKWYNPLTWGNSDTTDNNFERFSRNKQEYLNLVNPVYRKAREAAQGGDWTESQRLGQQARSGNVTPESSWYNPLSWHMGGLNPLVRNAAYYRNNMHDVQHNVQNFANMKLKDSMGTTSDIHAQLQQLKGDLDSGKLFGPEQEFAESQMAELQRRQSLPSDYEPPEVAELRQRMTGAGMNYRRPGMQSQQPRPGGISVPGNVTPESSWYNPLSWHMGGLNPLVRNAAYYRNNMHDVQHNVQNFANMKLKDSMGTPSDIHAQLQQLKGDLDSGKLFGPEQEFAESQMAELQRRQSLPSDYEPPEVAELRQRMTGAGMNYRRPGMQSQQPRPGGISVPGSGARGPGGQNPPGSARGYSHSDRPPQRPADFIPPWATPHDPNNPVVGG